MPNLYLDIPVPASNAAGAAVDVSGMGLTKTLLVSGDFEAAINFELSNDPAALVWAPLAHFTAPGKQNVDSACHWIRAVTSSYKGGAANADVGASNAGTSFVELVAPAGSGPGASVDISLLPPTKTVVVGDGGFTGGLFIEVSEDGTSWFPAAAFYQPGDQTFLTYAQFARVSRANGGGGVPSVWVGAAVAEPGVGSPPFESITTTIYARLAGSDTTGDGKTEPTAYRTFQRAIRDVPNIIPPGVTIIVDITGIGVETLPANYQLPVVQGTFDLGALAPNPFIFDHAFNIRAFPQLVVTVPPSEAVITAGSGFTRGVGPNAQLIDITVPGVRASWAAGAMRGKHLIRTGGGGPQTGQTTCVIYDSLDDDGGGNAVLRVCNRILFIVNSATLGAAEYQIVEPSAILEGPPATTGDFAVVTSAGPNVLAIQGVEIRCDTPGAAGSLGVTGCAQPFTELCSFPDGIFASGATVQFGMFSTLIGAGGLIGTGCLFTGRRSLMLGSLVLGFDGFYNEFFNSAFIGCVPISNNPFPSGIAPMDFGLSNCLVDSSTGNGVDMLGGRLNLTDVTIKDCVGDALNMERGDGYAMLNRVNGAGNGGLGIRANDGYKVQITDTATTTVTGAAGDLKSGDLAIAAYAALPQFDITAVAASPVGATGTGTRIFERA